MSYTRPGRLYRILERLGIALPLLTVVGDTFDVADNSVTSVSISHGGTDPSPSIQPSTCETLLQRPAWIKTGETFSVALTDAASTSLAKRTSTPAAQIQQRFNGRVGSQVNEDSQNGLSARLKAASWSAQLGRVNQVRNFSAGQTVGWMITSLCTPAAIPQIDAITRGTFDVLAENVPDASYRENIEDLTSAIGTLARETRNGMLEIWALPYRATWAVQQLSRQFPITRSQAISPVMWEQPNEDLPAKVRADWTGADGNTVSRSSGGTNDSIVERHDWTQIKAQTDALNMRFEALVAQQWNRVFRVPKIEVDLLYLLASDLPNHAEQAGSLLTLDAGDTVGFSGDWSPYIQGIHVVSGIDERITKDSWTMTLSLIPYYVVFGEKSPPVPARIWESARNPWRDDARTWKT